MLPSKKLLKKKNRGMRHPASCLPVLQMFGGRVNQAHQVNLCLNSGVSLRERASRPTTGRARCRCETQREGIPSNGTEMLHVRYRLSRHKKATTPIAARISELSQDPAIRIV